MTKSFKSLVEPKDTDHFRILEVNGGLVKRKFKTDGSYVDSPLEEDPELHTLVLGMDDVYF